MKRIPLEITLTVLIFVALCFTALSNNTAGDTGDSIFHYLYSHYAFKHPGLFLDHWAKPVFVLLSSPFAQPGFAGIKIFNCLCAALTALLTFYTAKNLKLKNPYFVFILIFFSPLYFKLIFSGLTEYLFALILIAGIYSVTRSKHIVALVLISFLPLVRSEGLLIIGVFGLYYLLNKKYKLLPYLAAGQFIYTLAGALYFKDALWVFTKIPYANIGSPYGHGGLLDFAHRLNYVIEKPVYVLLLIGIATLIYRLVKNHKDFKDISTLLVFGSFIVFFAAHSIFWWKGIFNSMGLPRVLISVVPLIAIIALGGVQTITGTINNLLARRIVGFAITAAVCLFPFSYRPRGIVFNKELLTVKENDFAAREIIPFIKTHIPDYINRRLYYTPPYLSLALNADHFDTAQHKDIHHLLYDAQIPKSAVIIWDSWFAVSEGGISFEQLRNDKRFTLLKVAEQKEKDFFIKYAVFKMNAAAF